MQSPKPRRIDQMLSHCGYCSRSDAVRWVRAGRIIVGGKPATSTDQKAAPSDVLVDGAPLDSPDGLLTLFHKPPGCVCSRDDREGPTIYGYFPERWLRRNPPITSVGRLDRDTTGVLLITDDGALVQRWTSPRHKVPKVYEVTVDADRDDALVGLFASGTLLLDGETKPCLPAKLEWTSLREARLEVVEGRFHQVKRMFGARGYNVTRLHRSRFGDYELAGLAPGQWRVLATPAS